MTLPAADCIGTDCRQY